MLVHDRALGMGVGGVGGSRHGMGGCMDVGMHGFRVGCASGRVLGVKVGGMGSGRESAQCSTPTSQCIRCTTASGSLIG